MPFSRAFTALFKGCNPDKNNRILPRPGYTVRDIPVFRKIHNNKCRY